MLGAGGGHNLCSKEIESMKRETTDRVSTLPAPERIGIEDSYSLSPIQEGMLFHSLAVEGSGLYVQQMVCVLKEDLDLDLFERAWRRLADRHPVLRTIFRWKEDGLPRQDVLASSPLEIEIRNDLIDRTAGPVRPIKAFLEEDRRRGFDLGAAPPWRLTLFQMPERKWTCIWTFHHLLLDGRSHTKVFEEVFSVYDALGRGESIRFEKVRPFKEYVEWFKSQDMEEAERF